MTSKLLSQAIGLSGTTGNSTNITVSSNGSLQLAANGGTDIFISANDNIGFGNTTPADKLSIQGSLYTSSNTVTIGTAAYFVANGNVGIGNSSPTIPLHVQAKTNVAGIIRVMAANSDLFDLTLGVNDSANGSFLFENKSKALRFGTSAVERMRIAANGNIGIGNFSTPSWPLHISGGGAGRCDIQLTYNSLGNTYTDGVQFGINDVGAYIWNWENSSIYFGTNNAKRMLIDSDGTVGIGISTNTVATNFRTEIVGTDGNNNLPANSGVTQVSSAVLRLKAGGGFTGCMDLGCSGGNGGWIQYTDSANLATTYALSLNPTGGNVGVGVSPYSYTISDNTPITQALTNGKLHINGSVHLKNNNDAYVVGYGTGSFFKDEELGFGWGGGWYMTDGSYIRARNDITVYSAGDAYFRNYKFPPTATNSGNANTLDDYEEGTWTPVIGGITSVNYNYRDGSYTKIGNMVYAFWDLQIISKSGTFDTTLGGLPFTIATSQAGYSTAVFRSNDLFTTSVAGGQLKAYAEKGQTYIVFQVDNSGTNGFGFTGNNPTINASGRSTGYIIYQASF